LNIVYSKQAVKTINHMDKQLISPDDVLTDEDIADIEQARFEFARGEYVRHENINWG